MVRCTRRIVTVNREGADKPIPMDVGLIVGKGKGKAKEKPIDKKDRCLNCGKPGHWARDCWATGGGAAKGQAKGKFKAEGWKE